LRNNSSKQSIFLFNYLLKIDFENRIFGLDLLRFFAIFYVMFRHANDLILPYANKKVLKALEFDGVTIFFVLSGFLIGRILLKIYFQKENLNWGHLKHFWMRRWLRTIPPYFLVLTVLVAISLFRGYPFRVMQLKFYLFIQNLWYPHPLFFGEAYSLAVEEWFYLAFPLLLFALAIIVKQRSKQAFLFTVAFFIIISLAFRTYVTLKANHFGLPIGYIYKYHIQKIVITRFDSLMYGVLAAYIFYRYPAIWNRHKSIYFFSGLIILIGYKLFPWAQFGTAKGIWGLSIMSIGIALLLPLLNTKKRTNSWLKKFIVIISVSSYAMYLINLTLRQVLIDYLPADIAAAAYFKFCLFWILSIVASIIFYRIIEYPVLLYRDKLFKKQSI